jgi:hypothetical protein
MIHEYTFDLSSSQQQLLVGPRKDTPHLDSIHANSDPDVHNIPDVG